MDVEEFIGEYSKTKNEWQNLPPLSNRDVIYYNDHCREFKEMQSKQNEIMNGLKLTPNGHKEFLEKLLHEKYNGIADIGRDKITHDEFYNLIEDESVLQAIEELFKNPNGDTGSMLANTLLKHINGKGKFTADYCCEMIANRVVASCNDKVSAVIGPDHFPQVFQFLSEMIGDCSQKKEWYDGNLHLMDKLKEFFAQKLENEKIDIIHLRIFVWYVWREFVR